jgi:putative salt-induced outer membrane protein YdiY
MKRSMTIWFVLISSWSPLWADQVQLKNGDRVTGQVVKKDGGDLTFKSDVFGDITIPWEQVTRLSSEALLTVVHPDGRMLQGKVSTDDSRLVVVTAAGTQESMALADAAAIRNPAEQTAWERLQAPGWLQLWGGYLDFGTSLARGNAETTTLTTAINADRTTRTDKTKLYFNQIYATATVAGETATSAQAIRGGWAYNRNMGRRVFINLFNDWEYDRFQNLDLRFVIGPGVGYSIVKTERTQLDLLGGGAYTHEEFSTPLSRNSGSVYWGNDLSYKFSGQTSFTQAFRMFNNLSQTGEYRMNFDLGTVTALTRWLSFQVTYSDRYLSNPAGGRKKNDVLFTTGLRLNFAR